MNITFTKTTLALAFIFCILLVGCQKEEVIDEVITEEEDPVVIDYPYFSGFISDDNGTAVSNATIEVYQNGDLLGTTTSKEDGSYSTHQIPIKASDKNVHLFTKKEGLASKLKILPAVQKEENIKMYSTSNTFIVPQEIENPGDTTLVKVSGNILTVSGQPTAGAFVLGMYDFVPSGDDFYGKGSHTFTDEEGYFEYYIPKETETYFYASETLCGLTILSINEFEYKYFPWDIIEPMQMDTVLALNNARDLDINDITVSGKILSCEGLPLANDTFFLFARYDQNISERVTLYTDDMGNFNESFKACSDEIAYKIYNKNGEIYNSSDAIIGQNISLGDINVCGEKIVSRYFIFVTNDSGGTSIDRGYYNGLKMDDFYDINMDSTNIKFTLNEDGINVSEFSFVSPSWPGTVNISDITSAELETTSSERRIVILATIHFSDNTVGQVRIQFKV